MRTLLSIYVSTTIATCALQTITFGEILGGWDASPGGSTEGLSFTGQGTHAEPNKDYIYGSSPLGPLTTVINKSTGATAITNIPKGSQFEVTFRIDLDGSETLEFDEFWLAMQRQGTAKLNLVHDAVASIDNFRTQGKSLEIREVAVGLHDGSRNVGPYDTINQFRPSNGMGGSITPQQVYRFSGLEQVGELNSGSLWIKYKVGESDSNSSTYLTLINDRYDLTTTSIALSKKNVINDPNDGVIDGYDVIWTGKKVDIPEAMAASLMFGALAFSITGLRRRRSARR